MLMPLGPDFFLAQTPKGRGLFAAREISAGEVILHFEPTFTAHATTRSLRVGESFHQLSDDPTLPENFINHSCRPTAYIDFNLLLLIAERRIRAAEEITYNYLTSDWDGEDVFACLCGSPKCYLNVAGFRHLPLEAKRALRGRLSPYLLDKLKLEEEERAAMR